MIQDIGKSVFLTADFATPEDELGDNPYYGLVSKVFKTENTFKLDWGGDKSPLYVQFCKTGKFEVVVWLYAIRNGEFFGSWVDDHFHYLSFENQNGLNYVNPAVDKLPRAFLGKDQALCCLQLVAEQVTYRSFRNHPTSRFPIYESEMEYRLYEVPMPDGLQIPYTDKFKYEQPAKPVMTTLIQVLSDPVLCPKE